MTVHFRILDFYHPCRSLPTSLCRFLASLATAYGPRPLCCPLWPSASPFLHCHILVSFVIAPDLPFHPVPLPCSPLPATIYIPMLTDFLCLPQPQPFLPFSVCLSPCHSYPALTPAIPPDIPPSSATKYSTPTALCLPFFHLYLPLILSFACLGLPCNPSYRPFQLPNILSLALHCSLLHSLPLFYPLIAPRTSHPRCKRSLTQAPAALHVSFLPPSDG